MKILLLRGYQRENGFTRKCTDLFVKGLIDSKAEFLEKNVNSLNIKSCMGCYNCWVITPGVCVIKDDMEILLKDILASNIIVFTTPLNAFTTSNCIKNVLDRCLALTKPNFEISPLGTVRNSLRFKDKWPKKLAYIAVGAFKGEENFTALKSMFSLFANAMNMEICGELIRPESYLMQFDLAKPLTVKSIESAFIKAGYELGTYGNISKETQEKAGIPLSPDITYFMKYSNIYWEHASKLGEKSKDLELLRKLVMSDVRILMQEMARSVDPDATSSIKISLQFEFLDKGYSFVIFVEHGKARIIEGKTDNPNLKVITDTDTWAKVFMRQINIRDAVIKKQIKLEGDKYIFTRLDRYFPPPVM